MADTEAHSYWSASGFEAVMLCPGKKVMEAGLPDRVTEYAAEGTAAHQVLTWALEQNLDAAAFMGRLVHIDANGRVTPEQALAQWTFEVDDDMADSLQTTIDLVRELAGGEGVVLVDRKVNYSAALGVDEDKAWGTLDVAVLLPDEIVVLDLKYGRGVQVSAENNPQMSLYALGAIAEFGDLGDFDKARLVISQPRVSRKPSVFQTTVEDLRDWAVLAARETVEKAEAASAEDLLPPSVWEQQYLAPGEKQCKFCRAAATCPALRDDVTARVFDATPASPDEFAALQGSDMTSTASRPQDTGMTDADWLGAALGQVDMIEDWCKAVRAEADRRLLAGEAVPGWKVVAGKKGNRAWSDPAATEELLKKVFRLKDEVVYNFKLKSPTQIAKLGPKFNKEGKIIPPKEGEEPPVIGPRQWPKIAALITQAEGKPHVAPESDPRPALDIRPVAEDFQVEDDLA